MRRIVILLSLLPLAACGLFESKELRTLRKSPDYRAGYQDGCNSAWSPDADKRHERFDRMRFFAASGMLLAVFIGVLIITTLASGA